MEAEEADGNAMGGSFAKFTLAFFPSLSDPEAEEADEEEEEEEDMDSSFPSPRVPEPVAKEVDADFIEELEDAAVLGTTGLLLSEIISLELQ